MSIVLASSSPRRQELLRRLCPDFAIDPPRCDEALPPDIAPEDAVALLSLRKAEEVLSRRPGDLVIGADTVVTLGRRILGKPADRAEARAMLSDLAGRAHQVHTGVAVLLGDARRCFVSSATVVFSAMSEEEIFAYAATGECDDKAGAYAVQGLGARFIERVEGDFHAVVGLPVQPLYRALRELGLSLAEMSVK